MYQNVLHDPLYYGVNPDILSPVGDHLPGNGCGSPNHTCIWLFLFVYLLIIYSTLCFPSRSVSKAI